MLPLIIHSGQRFGLLSVTAETTVIGKSRRFLCKCDCGQSTVVALRDLTARPNISCGCRRGHNLKTHGCTKTPEHLAWKGMLMRCCNPKSNEWGNYGGRGIQVCDRWKQSFPAFLEDMGARPSLSHSIDRINNDGNYEPGNCRWATLQEQNRNKRGNVWVNYGGVRRLLIEVAEETGKNISTVRLRRFRGWPDSELFR